MVPMVRPTMVFSQGLPAAGKSTVVRERFIGYNVIDPDEIKKEHPEYDPRRAFEVHEWSMERAESQYLRALASGQGRWVVDGTGTNVEKMVRRMNEARALGFHVVLLYVTCSLQTSLRRAALRERQVPEYVIREKARDIATAFQLVAPHADEVIAVDNDRDR